MDSQRTPPNKYLSDSNIPLSMEVDNEGTYVNTKKRNPHNEIMRSFEIRFEEQMSVWNSKFTESVTKIIATEISTAFPRELSKITEELSSIKTNVIRLTADCNNLQKSVNEMEKSLHFVLDRQDDFESQLTKIENNVSQTTAIAAHIQSLEQKILFMEQQARQCDIELSGIPDRRGENLISLLECLGNTIKQPIQVSDIVAVHRVPHADQKDRRPKNIIVKFSNRMLRDNVIAACRATKGLNTTNLSIPGSPTNVYVNEHLTLSNKLLFRQCREAARAKDYKYVWIKHGTVLVRKMEITPAFAIRSSLDISKIK